MKRSRDSIGNKIVPARRCLPRPANGDCGSCPRVRIQTLKMATCQNTLRGQHEARCGKGPFAKRKARRTRHRAICLPPSRGERPFQTAPLVKGYVPPLAFSSTIKDMKGLLHNG
jgi:hypothetical protein